MSSVCSAPEVSLGRGFVDDPCSHGLFSVVGPDPNSQHTTRLLSICGPHDGWTHGRRRAWGMRSFPFVSLAARGGGVIHLFVATSHKYKRSAGRLRRCEPPPPPNDLSMAIVHLGGLRNCSFCMPHLRGCPWFVTKMFIARTAGPGPSQTAVAVSSPDGSMRWVRRRFAPPCRPGRVSCDLVVVPARPAVFPYTLHCCHRSPLLNAAPSSCWSANEPQSGAIGHGVKEMPRVRRRGSSAPAALPTG